MSHNPWFTRLQFKYGILTIGFCIIILYFFQMRVFMNNNSHRVKYLHEKFINNENNLLGHLIDTSGCKIQDFQKSAPAINRYLFKAKPIICNGGKPSLFESNSTSIFLVKSALSAYNHQRVTFEEITCCYQYFRRRAPENNEKDTNIIFDNDCINVNTSAEVNPAEDFLRTVCKDTESAEIIYEDYFHFISQPKSDFFEEDQAAAYDIEDKLNVLILGLDSVSRLNFHRQMPKTHDYLKYLSGIELLGYNKIGDNTFPNLMVLLTGYNETELLETCWPNATTSYFDDCGFIWDKYKNLGYATAFGEDAAWMGLFNYQRQGFQLQPTDYYYHHFDYIATNRTGNSQRSNVHECLGSRLTYEVFLKYVENYVFAMRANQFKKKYFGFFWSSSLTHDYLNHPQLGDARLTKLLDDFNQDRVFNDTVLILLSDHGIRWGSIRQTYQGNIEERLPFIYIVLPEWYKRKYPELIKNLNRNAKRLTTPYDLHHTILNLLNPLRSDLDDANDIIRFKQGISLFDKIPEERTCEDAGIAAHWCTCRESIALEVYDTDVQAAVHATLYQHINNMLFDYQECSQLQLHEIINGRKYLGENEESNYVNPVYDFGVTFRTMPGGGIFEATVRKNTRDDHVDYSVTGSVSRLNLYGHQSDCIKDFHLKLYCYCRSYESIANKTDVDYLVD